MTEDERAALYRQQASARERAALSRWTALVGSADAYVALLAKTEALRRNEGWDPVEYVTEQERAANG